jgi:hypothetical protein
MYQDQGKVKSFVGPNRSNDLKDTDFFKAHLLNGEKA